MRLTDFLKDLGNPVAYYPKLVAVTGGVLPNLFLCQMYYWLGKQKDDQGWIYKTQIEIELETGLTRKEQESARKSLKARGLLKEQFKGCPRRLEFWLDKEALNQRWSAFMNNIELPIQEITSSWTRKTKKSQDDTKQKPSIMPNLSNIECPSSAIYNALQEQYILPSSSNTECSNMTGYIAPFGHTVMPDRGNISIYTEITSEITHNAPLALLPAPPTQESVCGKEKLDLTTKQIELEEPTPEKPSLEESTPEEPTPKLSTSLLNKSEYKLQTDNPSCRPTIAAGSFDNEFAAKNCQPCCDSRVVNTVNQGVMKAGSFSGLGSDKSEQLNNQLVAPNPKSASPTSLPDSTCYTMHPTEKTEQAMRVSGLPPWMDKAGPNGWKAEFVESYRQYLNSTPRYAKELIRQATTGEAKNALTRLSKTDSGKAEIQNHWDSFNELKERQQPTESKHNANTSNDDVLAMAIAADEERRQQELFKQEHKNEYRFSPQMLELKAKLQAAVNTPKVPSNTRPSSMNLREVEAQLKLAR
jgi:hypothetical protein